MNDSFSGREENDRRNYFLINLHESMGPGRDRTRDPWICSQLRICNQTRYRLHYAARYSDLSIDHTCFESSLYLNNSLRYLHETDINQHKTTCNTKGLLLCFTFLKKIIYIWPVKTENCRFCNLIVSAL